MKKKFNIIKLVTVRTVFTPGVYHKDLLIIYKIIAVLLGSELFPQQFQTHISSRLMYIRNGHVKSFISITI